MSKTLNNSLSFEKWVGRKATSHLFFFHLYQDTSMQKSTPTEISTQIKKSCAFI